MAYTIHTHGWTANLERIFRLYSVRLLPYFDKQANPRLFRHHPGTIWKTALAQSIFADLSLGIRGRRFIPLEHLGLSGVILYELPVITAQDDPENHSGFTLKSVFGDDSHPDDLGMDVEDLLDAVCGTLIYVPAQACTSFVVSHFWKRLTGNSHIRPGRPGNECVSLLP